jgi:hypothetical protein
MYWCLFIQLCLLTVNLFSPYSMLIYFIISFKTLISHKDQRKKIKVQLWEVIIVKFTFLVCSASNITQITISVLTIAKFRD